MLATRRETLSIDNEVRALAWAGVMLIATGTGIVIKNHLHDIGPLTIAIVIAIAAAGCYLSVRTRFSRAALSEYVVLLGALLVSADVTNTGQREGTAVVQLYIHQRAGSASRPVRQLKGFERVALAAGAKQTVHFKLGKDELQFYSPTEKTWVVEPEAFDVWVGGDSAAPLHGEFELSK